jgi:hypothetical protein
MIMNSSFPLRNTPELAAFTPAVRQLLLRRAVSVMRRESRFAAELPTILSGFGAVIGWLNGFLLEFYLIPIRPIPEQMEIRICYYVGSAVIVALAGGYVGLRLELQKLRPFLQRAIQDYAPNREL